MRPFFTLALLLGLATTAPVAPARAEPMPAALAAALRQIGPVIDPPATDNAVQRILLEGLSWQRFEQLSACFEDSRAVRLTYLDGSLEILSPSGPAHATLKRTIGYLLEASP